MAALKKMLMLFLIGNIGSLNSQETNPCKYMKNGVAVHPETCSKYYQCKNNKGTERECKHGEVFTPKSKTCVKESKYQCPITTTTTTTTTEPATTECWPHEESLEQFTLHEFEGSSYYISIDDYTTDDAAAQMCEAICGYLVEVDSQEEEDQVRSIMEMYDTAGLLIAGTDKYEEGVWEIARDRSPVNYLNWHSGEPNDYGQNEDCMCFIKGYGGLYDCPCTAVQYWQYKVACEVNLNENEE
ncbi:unnamed protein product [Lymnaea stagnalis]|uniref:Uncharacterized protein n=1 Tax=Lymnaea stagnalis TaxID=6523 RepID=A0AAV2HGR7_LYMST